MEFSIKEFKSTRALAVARTGCIVLGVYQKQSLSPLARVLDTSGALAAVLACGDISGKPGTTLLLRGVPGIAAQRVLLVGMGEMKAVAEADFRKALQAALAVLGTLGCDDAVLAMPLDVLDSRDCAWAVAQVVQAARAGQYRRDTHKSRKDPPASGVSVITIAAVNVKANRSALDQAVAVADGVDLARMLGDLPPNVCTPAYLAATAQRLANQYGFDIDVLERKQLQELKMGSFLAVSQGSAEPPKLIVLKYKGGRNKDAPVVLVGKGLTFDSGGISIKPGAAMDEMKYDMGGAAAVLGVFRSLAELQPKMNVIGVIGSCENMPSGDALKPGDIVTAMNGLTIEVLNTDAEGRLVLCDALTYVERFKPALVIDIATLTGACTVALGQHNSGLFTRNDAAHDALARQLLEAGRQSGDRAWRMPVEDAYLEQLKSNFADLANIGTPGGGAVVAAVFLEQFTKKYTWAHLDIAGTAWKSGGDKGATGRPVPLLVQFLLNFPDQLLKQP